MQQRDTFLDFCKGAAIFLVVLGHVLLKSMDLRNGLFNCKPPIQRKVG